MKLDSTIASLPRPEVFSTAGLRSFANQADANAAPFLTVLPPRSKTVGGLPFLAQILAQEIDPAQLDEQAESADPRWQRRDTAYRLARLEPETPRLSIEA